MSQNDLYNKDELTVPEWLNKQFFERLLEKVETKNTKITDLVLKPGTLKNDHYASVLYRAKVSYVLESKPAVEKMQSFILKIEPFADGFKKDIIGDLHLFQTEIRMYNEVLPKIESVLRQYGDETVLGPKLIDYSDTSPCYVIFEDLALKDYDTVRSRHTNIDEVKFALMKLAKLHAISYKLNKEKPNSFAALDKGSMNSLDVNNFEFLKNATKYLKEILNEHNDLKKYIQLIDSVDDILLPKTVDMFNEGRNGKSNDGLYVLNHGDFHSKNMMIQYLDGKLKDLMLLDYQISVFGSPAIDLHYAFTMMFSPEMRRDHYDELLYFYITNFQDTLRKAEFHGHIPTNTEIRQELQKHRYWGLFLVLSFLIFSYAFADEKGDFAQVIENPEAQKRQLRDSRLLNELRELLPKLLYEGYFEY